ncbi:hypothetical protein RhiirC2_799900 [Rhizophagus irregularis]|uniref:FAR1 domain-containing protein n=1 Tax=Rhizophagus irregularis TaxID=588596 RepID=A0A2N1M4B0_9GLOM|nr:hypothetical protein RhiirC2_799900 [Rhizophagus irregularis]
MECLYDNTQDKKNILFYFDVLETIFALNTLMRVKYSKSSDPNNRIVKKRIFTCENARRYKLNKTRPIEQQCNKGSKKTNCKWHINLSKPESNSFIHITFIHLEHNHTINADNTRFATSFRKFDNEIIFQIEHAIVHKLRL